MADNIRPPLQPSARPSHYEPSPEDIEKLRAWQEERLQRKAEGRVNDNLDTPLRISSVRINGATHTSQSFLDWLLRPHLALFSPSSLSLSPTPQPTLHTVLHTTRAISHTLTSTDLFRSLTARIERIDLVFNVKERGRFFLKSSTEVGNGEGSASLTARLTNIFGYADVLSLNTSLGTKTKRAFDASFSLPVSPSLSSHTFLGVVGTERELGVQGGGGREEKVGVRTGVRTFGGSEAVVGARTRVSEITAEGVWRCIAGLNEDAGISIRQSAGPSLKASLTHTYTYDTLNDRVMPTSGSFLRIINELALAGKVDSFISPASSPFPLFGPPSPATLSLTAHAGLLHLLAGDPSATHYSDKFQLGGPLSIRAFGVGGMGGREGPTSVGGAIYYALGLSVLGNIPKRPEWPVKIHGWVNAGRVQGTDGAAPLPRTLQTAITHPSISAGLGFVYRFDPIRAEVNFGVPLVAAKGEALRRGVQVGIGLEVL
ncbi:surface antigen-domain-containing protein [Melanogaster broomeanus]|nr:surface antigen-domain-containing protein [Melanogaster broomeanus]